MKATLTWDEAKRQINLQKHKLDFADANVVLDSHYRMDVEGQHGDEWRMQSFSYVMGVLAVLTVVHTPRDETCRIISFRCASSEERRKYYDWLDHQA